jgi:hypothetical protein
MAINPAMFANGFENRLQDLMDHCRNMPPVSTLSYILVKKLKLLFL